MAGLGLRLSPVHQILVEQSVLGWKEFELEVMRDSGRQRADRVQHRELRSHGRAHRRFDHREKPRPRRATDKEYQKPARRLAWPHDPPEIGVDTGGSNIQFAVNPANGDMVVIEMNPRVSRLESALASSKATRLPASPRSPPSWRWVYTARRDPKNDITRVTPASFEPSIDYVVVKIPRFAFEKFPKADQTLTTQMKSVGEAMAIGRTFREALQKALRSLENDRSGLDSLLRPSGDWSAGRPLDETKRAQLRERIRTPTADRLWWLADGLRAGFSLDEIHQLSHIDPWFLRELGEIVAAEGKLTRGELDLKTAKQWGFSDKRIGALTGLSEGAVREERRIQRLRPVYKRVDTCAAEFTASTPYLYSSYEEEDEAAPTDRRKVMILGSGPNRIGQGLEFDTCCVQAAGALRAAGIETVMVNCNPETVSTDYDTSDRLYFEPLTLEDVLAIHELEKPMGVIVQMGGQTPLKLAHALMNTGVKILGTSPEAIDRAEDRKRFAELLEKLGLRQAEHALAESMPEALKVAERIGLPVMVRPSYVLGGRAMEVCRDTEGLNTYLAEAFRVSGGRPVLIDRFLEDATEVDVDAICDGRQVYVAGVMEHIEEAGIHSGDFGLRATPPLTLSAYAIAEIERQTVALANPGARGGGAHERAVRAAAGLGR